jgi:hypothetical protein
MSLSPKYFIVGLCASLFLLSHSFLGEMNFFFVSLAHFFAALAQSK